jgi:hypothetical protein
MAVYKAGGVNCRGTPRECVQQLDAPTSRAMRAMKQRGFGLQALTQGPAANPSMQGVNEVKIVLGGILAAGLLASPAVAQSASRFNGVAGVADRGVLVSQLGGEITFEGVQVLASFRF